MAKINLLPWRELKREEEKKKLIYLLIYSSLCAAFAILILNVHARSDIEYQMSRNQRLHEEIEIFNRQIKEVQSLKKIRQEVIAKMLVIHNLQSTRILTLHLFDELQKIISEDIYLTKLACKENVVSICGYAESHTHISELMRRIKGNKWLSNPVLTEVKTILDNQKSQKTLFKLTFTLLSKKNFTVVNYD